MIQGRILLPIFIVAVYIYCLPVNAHHSSFLFETSTPIVLKGRITEVHFSNPHSTIIIDTTDENGQTVRWAVENSSTLYATRQLRGLDESTFQNGAPITVCGYAPKQAYSTEQKIENSSTPIPAWRDSVNSVITGRLLILKDGPVEHWSHYGSLEACQLLLKTQ